MRFLDIETKTTSTTLYYTFQNCTVPFSRQQATGKYTVGGPLAQLAEQRTFNPWVVGSSPTGPTSPTKRIEGLMTPSPNSSAVSPNRSNPLRRYFRDTQIQMGLTTERLRAALMVAAISLSWLFFHPLARDEVNLNVVALAVALSLATSIAHVEKFATVNRPLGLILISLATLTVVSTIVSGGRMEALRDVALITMTVALGVFLSLSASRRIVLWGITGGPLLVAAVGWTLSIRRNGFWTGFDYEFIGVTGNGGPEHFNALVGLAAALALLGRRGVQSSVAALSAAVLGFTLLVAGPSIGVITLATTLLGAVFIYLIKTVASPTRNFLGLALGIVLIIGASLVAIRNLATRVAIGIGEFTSVDARYVIWESAIAAISPWGWVFGHGTFFWNQDSPRRSEAVSLMLEAGYPGWSHAHSSYLDLFLAFGVVGALLLLVLLTFAISISRQTWRESNQWTEYSLPLLVVFSLGVQAISQSNLVSRPAGWLLCGVLLGILAFSQSARGVTAKT